MAFARERSLCNPAVEGKAGCWILTSHPVNCDSLLFQKGRLALSVMQPDQLVSGFLESHSVLETLLEIKI